MNAINTRTAYVIYNSFAKGYLWPNGWYGPVDQAKLFASKLDAEVAIRFLLRQHPDCDAWGLIAIKVC